MMLNRNAKITSGTETLDALCRRPVAFHATLNLCSFLTRHVSAWNVK